MFNKKKVSRLEKVILGCFYVESPNSGLPRISLAHLCESKYLETVDRMNTRNFHYWIVISLSLVLDVLQ